MQTLYTCSWSKKLLLIIMMSAPLIAVHAQIQLRLIRANSRTVSIRDGEHFKQGYWSVMPERQPDTYYTEIPKRVHTVTFITDQDSISFKLSYGKSFDFIVLLDGKDSCHTRISATYKNPNTITRNHQGVGSDTIPFTLGKNRKIYVTARLNGSLVKNVQLDLGAGGTVINTTSVKKVNIKFDEKVNLANSDGINEVQSASKNLLQIGNLFWDNLSVAVAENMQPHEDLIIGNYLFKGKVLEINYDKRILVVYDTLPRLASTYYRNDVILDGGAIPYIRAKLTARGLTKAGWAMFDTGARTSIIAESDLPMTYRILTELTGMIGADANFTPRLHISDQELSGFEYKTRSMGGDDDQLHMTLGNDLLKRFNVILDNVNGNIYLQPNSLRWLTYEKRDEYYVVRIITALLVLIAGIVFLIKWRRKSGDLR